MLSGGYDNVMNDLTNAEIVLFVDMPRKRNSKVILIQYTGMMSGPAIKCKIGQTGGPKRGGKHIVIAWWG